MAAWRYYLISNRPETNDSMFTWKEFIAKNNNELLANLGNFVNRVIKFATAKYSGVVPSFSIEDEREQALVKSVNAQLSKYINALESVKLRAGLEAAMEISRLGNQYLQESKLDNSLFENQPEKCGTAIGVAVNLIYLLSAVFNPYMPSTSSSILRQLNAPPRDIPDKWVMDVYSGHNLGKAEYLFKRIEEKKEEEFRKKYGGGLATEKTAKQKKKAKGETVKTASSSVRIKPKDTTN